METFFFNILFYTLKLFYIIRINQFSEKLAKKVTKVAKKKQIKKKEKEIIVFKVFLSGSFPDFLVVFFFFNN